MANKPSLNFSSAELCPLEIILAHWIYVIILKIKDFNLSYSKWNQNYN